MSGGPCPVTRQGAGESLLTAACAEGWGNLLLKPLRRQRAAEWGKYHCCFFVVFFFFFWPALPGRDLKICRIRLHLLFLKPFAGEKLGVQGQSSLYPCLFTRAGDSPAQHPGGGTRLIRTGHRHRNRERCGHVHVCIKKKKKR